MNSCCLLSAVRRAFVMPWAALVLFAAGTGALFTAYIAENFFGVQPCILCLYQRVPYAFVAFLAIVALASRRRVACTRRLLAIAALAFFVNMGIATFHSGVERQWWKGTESCGVNPVVLAEATGGKSSAAALRESLLQTPTVRCDQINFTFLGITMANWNVLASLGLGLFALLAALQPRCLNGTCGMKN